MKIAFAPDFFIFPKKMELEDRKKIEMFLEAIICSEASLIAAKNTKLRADEQYEYEKDQFEKSIKGNYYNIASVKRQAILRQKGLDWSPADHTLCEEESEKEFQRWKNFTPEEKIREHRERIGLQEGVGHKVPSAPPDEEKEEDWEPMTDIAVGRWLEEEIEKEMERLEMLEALRKDRKN